MVDHHDSSDDLDCYFWALDALFKCGLFIESTMDAFETRICGPLINIPFLHAENAPFLSKRSHQLEFKPLENLE
jgi:hypothetical protein